jgi:ATP-binding cassette, subfamily B, bacterial MsbA
MKVPINLDTTVNIKEFTLESLRAKIAIITQETAIFNNTIRSNLVYGLNRDISQNELDSAAGKANIYDFINKLPKKYNTMVGDKGVRLSGGERQRVAIARAILKNAEILILDEATSALDSQTELLIQKSLGEMARGKTVLAIAHRLSTIRNADLIVVLEDGKITEQGSIEELLDKKDRFYHYWQLQKFY